MGTSRKVLRKTAIGIEAAEGTYVDGDVDVLIPMTSNPVKQEWGMIEDEAVVGIAFKDLPIQGVRKVTGTLAAQVDVLTIAEILSIVAGDITSPYSLPTTENAQSISLTHLDEVKTNRYAGGKLNNFVLQSSAEGDLNFTSDFMAWAAESRVDDAFPTIATNPGTRLAHHHAGGTNGYCRFGDQANTLVAGDNINIKEFAVGVNWNFDFDFINSQASLATLSGAAGTPEVTLTFTVARHDTDAYKAWRDAHTNLQMELNYYASATAILKIQIPNIVITDSPESEDDVARIPVVCAVGRNGISTAYTNSGNGMDFNEPVRFTLTNS